MLVSAEFFFHDGGPGGDLPCPQGSMIMGTSGASFLGEEKGGNVYLLADTIHLDSTTVRGGGGDPPFDFLCNSTAGSVYIAGIRRTSRSRPIPSSPPATS